MKPRPWKRRSEVEEKSMFELVHVNGTKKTPYARRKNQLDAELLQQMHIRSISVGVAEVRKAPKAPGKKK